MPGLAQTSRSGAPLLAVGLLSAAVLAYEILLMRLFAIVHWHHFAFMMVSIALLGYGASGSLLALLPAMTFERLCLLFLAGAGGFGLTGVFCFAAAQHLPFNALEILWDAKQWGFLAGIYGLLLLPFLSAATAIGALLRFYNHQISKIYAADLAGAGIGASLAAGLLFHLPPAASLTIVAACAAAAVIWAAWCWQVPDRRMLLVLVCGGMGLAGLGAVHWGTPKINAYKPLAQAQRIPGTRTIYASHHPMGWFSALASPEVPFRHAPGLSLNSNAAIPEQVALYIDGQGMQAVDQNSDPPSARTYLRQTIGSVGLQLRPHPERVLIADAGGGQDVLRALAYNAGRIEAVDPHPLYPRFIQGQGNDTSAGIWQDERIAYHTATVRAFLAHTPQPYDIIQLPLGNPAGGGALLGKHALLTLEGVSLLWRYLDTDGLLVIPCWVRLPPQGTLKAFHLALAVLESQGIAHPSDHLALIRDWRTAVILIGKSALRHDDRRAVRRFCRRWGFDLVFLKGLRSAEVNRHNILARPLFAEGARALAGENRMDFIQRYKFDLRLPTDDRPFFGHFFRWQSLPEIATLRKAGGIGLLDWGYPVLLATLAQAALFSLVLIGFPMLWMRSGRQDDTGDRRRTWLTLFYFSAIGGGFIIMELAFMQRLTLFLHHPLTAATLTLGGFLTGAGVGSIAAHKALNRGLPAVRLLCGSLMAIVTWGVLIIYGLAWLLPRFMGMALGFKLMVALGFILPLAMAMGTVFPLGMAVVAGNRSQMVPWAWGVNGCATVMGAAAAPLLALHCGYTQVLGLAVLLYACVLVLVLALKTKRAI